MHCVCMEAIKRWLHFDNYFYVDSIGIGGGLSLMWSENICLQVTSFSSNFVESIVGVEIDSWRFIGFYCFSEVTRSRSSWNLLRALATHS